MNPREIIKKDILNSMNEAGNQIDIILETPNIALEMVQSCVHRYVCIKFFLEPGEGDGMTLREMAEISLNRAIEWGLPLEKESEKATTCGMAGSIPMKIALLLNSLRKDVGTEISPHKLGMVRDTKELGALVFESLEK